MSFLNKLKQKFEEKQAAIASALPAIRTHPDVQKQRFDLCLSCDKLYTPTKTCKVCGCFMQIKTWMPHQKCPLGKWGAADIHENDTQEK